MATTKKDEIIEIKPLDIKKVNLRIVGDTPLIMHAWSEKAKRMMLEAMMGKAKGKKKDDKNPAEEFINSMYWLDGKPTEFTKEAFDAAIAGGARFGFPATAFKQAAISAAFRMGWSKNKVSLQGEFFFEADENGMIEIQSAPPFMREDLVRVGMGKPDIRYRGEFRNWSAEIVMRYCSNGSYPLENIINMINAGGYVCGVGEWRPEKSGQNGMFHVE